MSRFENFSIEKNNHLKFVLFYRPALSDKINIKGTIPSSPPRILGAYDFTSPYDRRQLVMRVLEG